MRERERGRNTSNETIQFHLLLRRRVFGTIVRRVINRRAETRRGFFSPLFLLLFVRNGPIGRAVKRHGDEDGGCYSAISRSARRAFGVITMDGRRGTTDDDDDDGYSNHDMHCRDPRATPVLWPAHMHTRPLSVHHNNKHTHARTFNRTQASMHACTTRHAFHEYLDATESRAAPCSWTRFDRPAFSHHFAQCCALSIG